MSQSDSERKRREAHNKWATHKEHDPLPDVPETLLSRDVIGYVAEVGLIHTFVQDKEQLSV